MSTKMEVREKIEVPEGVQVKVEGNRVTLSKDKAAVDRAFPFKRIQLELKDKSLSILSHRITKKEKKIIGTTKAHIKNMLKGVQEGHTYKLKVCSGHFPMNIAVKGSEFVVKNFLGEKQPRVIQLRKDAEVKVEGDMITVQSVGKEVAGQTAADIEQLCRISNRDSRIFQDGIWIIEKDGKKV